VIDIGVVADGPFNPAYDRHQVARAAGTSIEGILGMKERRLGLEKMGDGASNLIKALCTEGEVGGVLAVGGSQGTAVALLIMKVVPWASQTILSTIAYSLSSSGYGRRE
jgi:uncharacterized protein (UPF0261 family)